jgi:hypothetical protein
VGEWQEGLLQPFFLLYLLVGLLLLNLWRKRLEDRRRLLALTLEELGRYTLAVAAERVSDFAEDRFTARLLAALSPFLNGQCPAL